MIRAYAPLNPMLDMKPRCERCETILPDTAAALICSYECTFCPNCAHWFEGRCPNCSSELVARPRRVRGENEQAEVRI
jgi:uncharacterized protein